NATSSKLYTVDGARPSTVQVRFAPMALPASGVAHVPRRTLAAPKPHSSVVPATPRMSYLAGWPLPSFTSVNDSVTDVSATAASLRSDTVPGLVTGPGTSTCA